MHKWGHLHNKIKPPINKAQVQQEKEREGGGHKNILGCLNTKNHSRMPRHTEVPNSRLCGGLNMLDHHLKSSETENKHGNSCKSYGAIAYSKCRICGVNLHRVANRGHSAGLTFFYNNYPFFRLARYDEHLSRVKNQNGATIPKLRERTMLVLSSLWRRTCKRLKEMIFSRNYTNNL